MRVAVAATAICLSIIGSAGAGDVRAAIREATAIAPQTLGSALQELARDRDFQLICNADLVRGLTTRGISGQLTPEEALTRLLSGTGLTYRYLDKQTVTVVPLASDSSGAGPARLPSGASSPVAASPDTKEGKKSSSGNFRLARAAQGAAAEYAAVGGKSASSPRGEGAPPANLEEIVVTAQKREERLSETPLSVSVVSSDALDQLAASQFRDFADTVPGLTFQTAGSGQTNVTLRGVTTGFDRGRKVSVYIDDVPYGSSSIFAEDDHVLPDMELFDVERIEVLRGPQGTLYGASSEGGLIKYVYKEPTPSRFGGEVHSGISDTDHGGINYDVGAAVNLPLMNTMALRASGFETHDGGYIDNVTLGRKNVDRADNYGGRLDLLFTPTDALRFRIVGYAQDTNRDGFPVALYNLSGTPVDGSLDQQRYFQEPFDQHFRLVSGTVSYDMSWASLIAISGYQSTKDSYLLDYTASFLPTLQAVAATRNQYSAVAVTDSTATDKYTQEIRLASNRAERLEWLVGAFYTHEASRYYEAFMLRDLVGQPAPNTLFTYDVPTIYEEYAGFGDLTWHITRALDLTGGARYAEDHQEFQQIGTGLFGSSKPLTRSTGSSTTWLGNARYKFAEHAMGYLRYATGYRPGGPNYVTINPTTGLPNGLPTFEPERLKSYETGFKADALGGRYGIDVSAYTTVWSSMQIGVINGGFASTGNASADAHIQGVELTITARPLQSMLASVNAAYQHAFMVQADPQLKAAEGERLPNVPRLTAAGNVDYYLPFARALDASVGATVRYVGERWTNFRSNTSFPYYHLPEYTMLDLRVGLTFGSVETQLYVHNLTDERAQLNSRTVLSPLKGPAEITILQPRTAGIQVSTKF